MNTRFSWKKLFSMFSYSANTLAVKDIPPKSQMSLDRLMEGNERYIKELLEHPNRSIKHIQTIKENQSPYAVILGCSDSRTSPVIIFDQGMGDLFEVRVAGNVVGPIEIASIEYAAKYLGSSLIFVMGHENCGAVKAVLAGQTTDIEPIANKIEAAIGDPKKITLENAVKDNVRAVVKQLRENQLIGKLIAEQKVYVTGGYYRLSTGKVEICCDIP